MARIPMVTRTIQTTKVNALCMNILTKSSYEKEFILSGTFKDNDSMLKSLKTIADSATHKTVHILSSEVLETLYGMTEQDFISNAKVLPPRSTKEANSESND